ncbi:probable C-mannosyltransferase DPY19L4, partial [Tachysurus ichikawai]
VMCQRLAKLFIGCLAAVTCGMMYAVYLSTYHERKFWFSTRQELEREITFQGGSGLYYYYYKHMLFASSFEKGNTTLLGFCSHPGVSNMSNYDVQKFVHPVSGWMNGGRGGKKTRQTHETEFH